MGRRIGILGLVNYRVHPTNQNYRVFSFNSEAEANMFQNELEKKSIWFERDQDEIKEGVIHLFGVEKSDYKAAMQCNYMVSASLRKPMIKNKFLRIALITLTASMITLGIIGYVKKMQMLEEKTEQISE
ncbi:MAG: hypothetical protein R2780_14275 [Crocinitomicaceae bacterium]|nr:hypothetical protein [Crocinitomicaceae bacterium]